MDVPTAIGLAPAAVAIAWTLRQSAVTGAIVGARCPQQVDDLIRASEFRLSSQELEDITQVLPDGTGTNVPESAS